MMSLRTGFLWTALVAFPIAGVILLSMFLWDKFHDGQVEKLQVAGAVSTPQNAEVQPSSAKSVVPTNAQLALTAKPVEPNTDAIHTGVEDEVRFVDGRLTWPQMKTPADAITVPDLTSSEPSPRRAIKSRVGAIWPLWR